MVNDIGKMQKELDSKEHEIQLLREKLKELPPLKLSSVYKDGLVYGICYNDGHGNIETLEKMSNQPQYLSKFAQNQAKNYLGYIVEIKIKARWAKASDPDKGRHLEKDMLSEGVWPLEPIPEGYWTVKFDGKFLYLEKASIS